MDCMKLKPTSKKKNNSNLNFPFIPRPGSLMVIAYFNGISCCVKEKDGMECLFESGHYGKGNLSKSFPTFNAKQDDFPEFLLEQQWLNRKNYRISQTERTLPSYLSRKRSIAKRSVLNFMEMSKKWSDRPIKVKHKCVPHLVSSIPSWSDTSIEENGNESDTLKGMVERSLANGEAVTVSDCTSTENEVVVVEDMDNARLENAVGVPKEELYLNLQESFFLAGVLGVLDIVDKVGKSLPVEDLWMAFQRAEPGFLNRYVAYHWYRAKGWVVRSGLIYGGDFVLYEKGPSFSHSSYVVRVLEQQETLSWNELASLTRLCETVQKDVIYCTVIRPTHLQPEDLKSPTVIKKFEILEVMQRRWIPTHHVNQKEVGI